MSRKIPLGLAIAIMFIAIAVTVAITMSVSMRTYNNLIKDLRPRSTTKQAPSLTSISIKYT